MEKTISVAVNVREQVYLYHKKWKQEDLDLIAVFWELNFTTEDLTICSICLLVLPKYWQNILILLYIIHLLFVI